MSVPEIDHFLPNLSFNIICYYITSLVGTKSNVLYNLRNLMEKCIYLALEVLNVILLICFMDSNLVFTCAHLIGISPLLSVCHVLWMIQLAMLHTSKQLNCYLSLASSLIVRGFKSCLPIC